MKVIKLTESDLNHIIRRVIQTEQDTEEEEDNNLVIGLKNFSRGRIGKDDLYRIDDSIDYIDKKEPLGQSIITIKFKDSEKFLKEIGLDEGDAWFMRALNSHNGYDFQDSYTIEQDFKEGYIVYGDLNDENTETLKGIATTILPNKEFEIDNDEYRQELSGMLLDLFPKEIDRILSDFEMEKNYEMTTVAKKQIEDEFNKPLEENNINLNYDMDEVDISVADLYLGALQLNLFNRNAEEIIIKLIEKILGNNFGGWYEHNYEYQDEKYFDSESFNREVERQFESIIEKLEERSEEEYTIQDFVEFRDRVTSKFKLKTWYTNPKDDNIIFLIDSFDSGSMSVKLNVKSKDLGLYKKLELDEEQFNNFLYQYSLNDYENMY